MKTKDPFYQPPLDMASTYDRILKQAYIDENLDGYTTRESLIRAAFKNWESIDDQYKFSDALKQLTDEGFISDIYSDGTYHITNSGRSLIENTSGKYRHQPFNYKRKIVLSENLTRMYGFKLAIVSIAISLLAIVISIIAFYH